MGSATLPPTGLVGKMWSIEKQSETKIPSEVRLLSISISRTAQGLSPPLPPCGLLSSLWSLGLGAPRALTVALFLYLPRPSLLLHMWPTS